MADDEQFSLCWNNFNSNLSAGFHESLCRGDLVDVTLAAEGQFVKAHRLVLSVCSPYFRKMFTQMPANQHAFVFLKDVSHTALKDLIQFMYCGEVNVKQEALPAFISTAEALQIKGLTDSDPPQSQTPPEPSTPTPQIQTQQIQASPRVRHRTSTGRSYKIETVDDSGDDTKQTTQIVIQTTAPSHPPQATITQASHHHQQSQHQPSQQHITQQPIQTQTHQLTSVSLPTSTATTAVVTHKRPAQRTNLGSVPHIKRSKSTIDPLEASDATVATQQLNVQTTVVTSDVTKSQAQQQQHHHHQQHHQQQQQQTQSHHHQNQPQQTNEPEYIDLPIELPTKSEPDYVEDAGEVDQGEQDGTYVEDESYGDMRYDESYFTEGEDAAASAGNAATGGGATNTSATATTSKAIVKSQPLSDSSYMDTTGDQGNSDAQGTIVSRMSSSQHILKQKTELYFLDLPCGVWLDNEIYHYMRNQKQGLNLIFRGYMYKKEASFRSTINWICSNGNGKRVSENKCTARCITKIEGGLKLGKNPHNHPPKFTPDTMPSNLISGDSKKAYNQI
ncbi:modifier of mdg4-like isoform X11 [Haematobia irritans]|uniref:modifier of mdg4-like isoform X11 n=1 Tax=Haematobia irritans TaxID=7368 RepID=UPI003F4FAB0C